LRESNGERGKNVELEGKKCEQEGKMGGGGCSLRSKDLGKGRILGMWFYGSEKRLIWGVTQGGKQVLMIGLS